MLPPESLEGRAEVCSAEDGEGAPADVLITLVSPLPCAFSGGELRWAEGAASEASDGFAIAMDLTNNVCVAPADRAVS